MLQQVVLGKDSEIYSYLNNKILSSNWWFMRDMKEATLPKNTHPAIAGNVGFSSMVDTFITRINIKFIHVKCSIRSSFKVPSNWQRLFIFLIYRLPNSAKRNFNTYFQEVE